MSIIGLLRIIEQLTRPAGHDDDRPLAEEEVSEARCDCCEHPTAPELLKSGDDGESWCCPDCVTEALASEAEWQAINGDNDDTPDEPWEPELNSSERVEVRQLIEERFGEEQNPFIVRLAERVTTIEQLAQVKRMSESWRDKSSASNHVGTGGASRWGGQTYTCDPTKSPSPTIVQSAPPPTVDGEGSPADSGIPPSPAGERPTSELLTAAAAGIEALADPETVGNAFHPLIRELRDRAATFKAIED